MPSSVSSLWQLWTVIEMGAIVPFVTSNLKVKQYTESLMKKPDALNLFSYGAPEGTGRQREAGE